MKANLKLNKSYYQLLQNEDSLYRYYFLFEFKKTDLIEKDFYWIKLVVITNVDLDCTYRISNENTNITFVNSVEFNKIVDKDVDSIEFDIDLLKVNTPE